MTMNSSRRGAVYLKSKERQRGWAEINEIIFLEPGDEARIVL